MGYTKERLIEAVKTSTSISQVLIKLGRKPVGGNISYMAKKLAKLGVDTRHFLGQANSKGKRPINRKNWEAILVFDRFNRKESTARLRRAMIESGIEYRCHECSMEPLWNARPLVLQIDHKNGDPLDNRRDNLRFLCPNCHSQTDNWGMKGRVSKLVNEHGSEPCAVRLVGSTPTSITVATK
jgi:hypothetical protein